jgi:hypothetical protein
VTGLAVAIKIIFSILIFNSTAQAGLFSGKWNLSLRTTADFDFALPTGVTGSATGTLEAGTYTLSYNYFIN